MTLNEIEEFIREATEYKNYSYDDPECDPALTNPVHRKQLEQGRLQNLAYFKGKAFNAETARFLWYKVKRLLAAIKRHEEAFCYDTSVAGWYSRMKAINDRLYTVCLEEDK